MGRWIRQRYVEQLKFLPAEHDPTTYEVQCTTANRTRESALYNFRGLYGEKSVDYHNFHVDWAKANESNIIGYPYANCDYVNKLNRYTFLAKEVQEFIKNAS